MQHLRRRFAVRIMPHQLMLMQSALLLIVCTFMISGGQAAAVTRFIDRSLFIANGTPGATTDYTVSFSYNTLSSIGSIDMQFCLDPIPYDPCVAPAGLDVSNATLSSQTGNTGFSVVRVSSNHLILSRTAAPVNNAPSSYTLSGIVNPTETDSSYSIRLSDYASSDASGTLVDLGSVVTEVNQAVELDTQVPPQLIFCVGSMVEDNCKSTSGINFDDLGTLDAAQTLYATSQMAAGTNASNGYAITANGTTMEAGTNQIDPIPSPTFSAPGNSQFGINLVANSSPNAGSDPDLQYGGSAYPAPNYSTPNQFMYKDGDVIAEAPHVSLMQRFTVTYIVNVPPTLPAGVYTTTLTYVCTGRF